MAMMVLESFGCGKSWLLAAMTDQSQNVSNDFSFLVQVGVESEWSI